MKSLAALVILLLACPAAAFAGAWPQAKGESLVILKYEQGSSDEKFDQNGQIISNTVSQDDNVSLYIEHGLSDRMTLQAQIGTGSDRQGLVSNGKGQFEFGTRYGLEIPGGAVSIYSGTAAFEDPDLGWVSDFELSLTAGRSGEMLGVPVFVEASVSRVLRTDLPHQVRADLTAGATPRPDVQVFLQAFSGRADDGPGRWIKLQPSVVLSRGAASLQLGWRSTLLGRGVAMEEGPVVALWRRF